MDKKEYEYVIVGDIQEYTDCLICVCGTYESAEKNLYRMINSPTENDKKLFEGHENLRIAEVDKKDCWWNHL